MSERSMVKTYKYRLKDRSGRKALAAKAYACNQVFNWCVAQHRDAEERYAAGGVSRKWRSAFELSRDCKGVGASLGIHQQTVQSVCDQFAKSRDLHKQCPKFRSSFGIKRALGWVPFQPQSRSVGGNSVTYLGKTFRFFGAKRRPLPANAKGGAFVEDAQGRWWVTFQVEIEQLGQASSGDVGIDLGLKTLATMSDGSKIENPRHLSKYADRLAVAQRAGDKRRTRAIHAKIASVRRDFHHKVSTRLSREYAFIAVGNVNAQRLAKTRMAKSVLDAGWSTFRTMLAYKAASYVEVEPVVIDPKKIEEIVREHFYPGPVAGSTARLTKALAAYVAAASTPESARKVDPATLGDVSSLIAARCSALPGALIDCPVCGAVDQERARQGPEITDEMVERARQYLRHGNLETAEAIELALQSIFDPSAALSTTTSTKGVE